MIREFVTCLVVIATAQLLPIDQYVGDAACMALATVAGIFAQCKRIEKEGFRPLASMSELGCSAMGGFCVHATMVDNVESFRIIVASSMVVGFWGAKGFEKFGRKFMPWMYEEKGSSDATGNG